MGNKIRKAVLDVKNQKQLSLNLNSLGIRIIEFVSLGDVWKAIVLVPITKRTKEYAFISGRWL